MGAAHPEMVEHVCRVGEHLNWHGPLGLAAIYDPSADQAYYLEACARIGETVPELLAGGNPCELVVRMSMGEEVHVPPPKYKQVRTHQSFLILVTMALKDAGRLTLAREVWRALRNAGIYEGSEDELTRLRDDWLSLVPATAITALLLAYPRAAQRLVRKTVENYALPADAAQVIARLSAEDLNRCFR